MKILLPGKNGQVGWELLACDCDSPGLLTADFMRTDALALLVRAVRSDVIINAAAHAIRVIAADRSKCGAHHRADAGETSWHGCTRFVIEWARVRGHALKVAPDAVRPVPTRDDPNAAARLFNFRLDTHQQQKSVGLVLPLWQLGVERMLGEVPGR